MAYSGSETSIPTHTSDLGTTILVSYSSSVTVYNENVPTNVHQASLIARYFKVSKCPTEILARTRFRSLNADWIAKHVIFDSIVICIVFGTSEEPAEIWGSPSSISKSRE